MQSTASALPFPFRAVLGPRHREFLFLFLQLGLILGVDFYHPLPLLLLVLLLGILLVSMKQHGIPWRLSAGTAFTVYLAVWFLYKYFTPAAAVLSKHQVAGLSFIGFKLIHFCVDFRNGRIQKYSVTDVLTWLFFFPTLLSGPIQRFEEWTAARAASVAARDRVTFGIQRIIEGMFLKFVLADSLFPVTLASLGVEEMKHIGAGAFCGMSLLYTVYLYWDFGGYTSMAIGLGYLFGVQLPENFNFPLTSRNLIEFWSKWHITLSLWLKEYVFFPVAHWLKRKPALRKNSLLNSFLPALTMFLAAGLWHGASLGYIAFGALHGIGVGFLSYLNQRLPSKHPAVVRWRTSGVAKFFCIAFNYSYVSFTLAFFVLRNEQILALWNRLTGS